MVRGRYAKAIRLGLLLAAFAVGSHPSALAADPVQPFKVDTLDGQEFDLKQFLGRIPVLLDFGSIYCSSCVTSIPHLITLQNRYGPEKLRVVSVNLDGQGMSRVRRFYGQFRPALNFPIAVDTGLTVSRSFGVNTLPAYILVGADAKVAYSSVGYDEEKAKRLDQAVADVIEKGATQVSKGQAFEQVVLLSPDSFTKTYQDSMSIVGLTGGRQGPFILRLNGGSENRAKSHGKMFWARTPLSLGSNYIEIRYPDGQTEGTQAVVLFREPLMGEGLQASFPEFQFHTPDREARCAPCHKMETEGSQETAATTTFCLRCHGNLANQTYVHGPIPVGGCGPCHDFSSKPHKYELVAQGSDLCFTCHEDIRDKFAKALLHGPVAVGLCVVCHSPHGTSFKYQIRMSQSDLCLGCHENMKPKATKFVLHRPFAEGRCSGCHDPHASDNPKFFLRASGDDLCRLCHDKEAMARHRHPVGRAPKHTPPGMQLNPEGNLVCQSCHDPHSTDNARMSPVPEGCSGCHRM